MLLPKYAIGDLVVFDNPYHMFEHENDFRLFKVIEIKQDSILQQIRLDLLGDEWFLSLDFDLYYDGYEEDHKWFKKETQ